MATPSGRRPHFHGAWPGSLMAVRHPEVTLAKVSGSRTKGTHSHFSDVDRVVTDDVDPLRA